MPLVPAAELLHSARVGGYALGYFESWNLESLHGVVDAAEETRSPVFIGFNGEFLTRAGRVTEEPLAWYGALGRAAAEIASVPCGLLFNECSSDVRIREAIEAGFNLAMLADPEAPYEKYERRVAALANLAHGQGAAIEAELGELPSGSGGEVIAGRDALTDPDLAAHFVAATGVDVLDVSVGNVHVMVHGQQSLDLEHLAKLRARVDTPLGLHGGTGIAPDSLRQAIQIGVVKVAFGTYLKQRYLAALRQLLRQEEINPHRLLGMGEQEDVMVATRQAVRDAVLERIEMLGCCGRA